MKADKNLIIRFDADKVSVKGPDSAASLRTAWYDITPIVKSHVGEISSSVMNYVEKVEVEIYQLLDDEEDYLPFVKEEFEKILHEEYMCLGCFEERDGLLIKNDARRIRLTFANGSVLEARNSEWGSILLG